MLHGKYIYRSGDGNLSTQPHGHCMWARSEMRTTVPTSWIKCLLTERLSLLPCMEDLIADIEPVLQPHCKKRKSSVSLSFCHQQGGKGVGPELEGAPAQALQTTSGHPCPSGVLLSRQLAICCSPAPDDLHCFGQLCRLKHEKISWPSKLSISSHQQIMVQEGTQTDLPHPSTWLTRHATKAQVKTCAGGSSCKQRQTCCSLSATKSSVD